MAAYMLFALIEKPRESILAEEERTRIALQDVGQNAT